MPIGAKIKEFRTKNSLTQKELAEKLNVTFQAVSRWENDEAEPSFDTLKEMTNIFGCTADDLFGIVKDEGVSETNQEAQPEIEKEESVFITCDGCKKHITDKNDLNRIEEEKTERIGRTSRKVIVQHTLCNDCLEIRKAQEEELHRKAQEIVEQKYLKRRIHSFVWPSIFAAFFIAGSIMNFVDGNIQNGIVGLVLAVLAFTFLGTMILFNTFIPNLWFTVASWGFVKMPGVIMEFSIDGIIAGIVVKIILWFFGLLIALAFAALATVIAVPLSFFVYPFAIRRNILKFGNI